LALILLVLLSCAFRMRINVEVEAPDGLHVHNLNTGLNYATIQEAIDANETSDGHTILVDAGTYYENVVVNKSVSLVGENKNNTVIDGNGNGLMGTVWLQSDNSSITGFTIRNGGYGIRIFTLSSFGLFTGHRIEDNCIVENLYGGILLQGCANNSISNNIVAGNTLFGIHISSSANNTIINNTVVNNGHGIDFYGNSNDNILRINNMTDNTYNFGLILRGDTRNFISGTSSKPVIVNDVDSSNTVDGKPIYYLVNRSSVEIPSDAGYVFLNNCTNITVKGCYLSHNLQGVLLIFCDNASVINNTMNDNVYGIYVGVYSSNNTLVGNSLDGDLRGVYLDDFSRFTTMKNNDMSDGDMNFGVSPDIGLHISDWSGLADDIDTSNTVDGKPIIYWINKHDQEVPTNAGYVLLIDSTDILIEGLNLSNNVQSIFLLGSNNTVIANNSVTHSIYGIDVNKYGWFDYEAGAYRSFCSFNTTVEGNIVLDNVVGMRIISDDSTISNNTLYRNPLGILADTSNSFISGNVVVASDLNGTNPGPELSIFYYPEWPWEFSKELIQLEIGGIIVGGGYNVICGNTLKDSLFGLVMYDMIRAIMGSGNLVFHNNFINNTRALNGAPRAEDNYDAGYPSGGNYWSDYNGTDLSSGTGQNETGSDGIGDKEYVIDGNSMDNYPLMGMFSDFIATTEYNVQTICNSTISDFQFNGTAIRFNVSGENGTSGFCRICIPTALMNATYRVFVNGTKVTCNLLPFSNSTHSHLYFNYTHSTQEVTIIPEFPSFLILPILTAATLLAFIVHRRKHLIQPCEPSLQNQSLKLRSHDSRAREKYK
jgi:parallel beta-helix repeat protein